MADHNETVSTLNRYDRQITLPQVGRQGQEILSQSSLLIVGVGGLGCPVSQYLVAAGIGKIILLDEDTVDLSNIHRQPLFGDGSIGQRKVEAARVRLADLNPQVKIEIDSRSLSPENVKDYVDEVDLVLDCADNFMVSYILSDYCYDKKIPLISASVLGMEGYVGGFCGNSPSLRAVFPDLPDNLTTCTAFGVMGPVVGILGSMQAQMTINTLLNLQPSPLGQLISVNMQDLKLGGFRFDHANEPESAPFTFIASEGLDENDFIAFAGTCNLIRQQDIDYKIIFL